MNKKFDKKYLLDKDLPWTAIKDDIVDNSRWSIIHNIIFEDGGKFWRTSYSIGATESQDERPWEYEDEIQCEQVELREVMIKKWIKVED